MSNYTDAKKQIGKFIAEHGDELQEADDNLEFERKLKTRPLPDGTKELEVFGESWDINQILKANYWNRTTYTYDKLSRQLLKAEYHTIKKYLRKKNPLEFNFLPLMLLIALVLGGAVFVILFVLPRIGAFMGG